MRRKREVHGMTHSPIYSAWQNMIARTTPGSAQQQNVPSYQGVDRDPRWDSFKAFYEDMWPSYFPGAALARLHDQGDYVPGNCRWVTKAENARERAKHFTSDGRLGIDVARENGVPVNTYGVRIARGWTVDRAAGVE
jgi:hypothetical protein